MRFLVTSGPTFEPLDEVRRLTNFSTGKLGTELGNFLADQGHVVSQLQGFYSTYQGPSRAQHRVGFTTSENLLALLQEASKTPYEAIFHAAAVSDFRFGKVFHPRKEGDLQETSSRKFSTRHGTLLAELVPTEKILFQLRSLFPPSKIIGWKYEVEGDRESACGAAKIQLTENRTDYCVINGPAYGPGFGLISPDGPTVHCPTPENLYNQLLRLVGGGDF